MVRFVATRILQFPLVLAIIYLLTFLMAWVAPGDPFQRNDRNLSPEALEARRREFHAESAGSFLAHYTKQIVLHGDFGRSMHYDEWTVNDILADALPISVTLGALALVIATFGGVALGTLAAVRRGGPFDMFSLGVALAGISLPSFVAGSVLLIVFGAVLKWMPIGGWGSPTQMILPAIALALGPMAYIARLTRVGMIDVLSSDYVRTARAKGLSRPSVVWKHALTNAILPVVSFLGPAAAATFTGSFVIESVFRIPGMGQHFVNSILNRDRTLILGTVIVYSFFLLALNLIVDILYAFVDPRIDVTAKT